jgi:hypothetical protein
VAQEGRHAWFTCAVYEFTTAGEKAGEFWVKLVKRKVNNLFDDHS